MGRYTGPACRLCRREGMKICDKHKCATVKRNYPPGMHGKNSRSKKSDYGKQMREKQKARRIFGVSEKHMQKYYEKAISAKGDSGEQLLAQLENRFDNAIFRAGLASTRRQARQLVSHGIILLNGHRSTTPSIQLKEGDEFEIRQKNKSMPIFENFGKKKITPPAWITVSAADLKVKITGKPAKGDIEASIEPQMIIEFYSR